MRQVTYSVTSGDNCPGEVLTQTAGLASGSLFPIGVTTDTLTVTDASGNTATCSFTVTVTDNEVPTIACPANISVTMMPNQCACGGNVFGNLGRQLSGRSFDADRRSCQRQPLPQRVTTNTFMVTDACGQHGHLQLHGDGERQQDPTIACPATMNNDAEPGVCAYSA